jgi:hypothetical protein
MSFFKSKNPRPDAARDRLAKIIADEIVLKQQFIAMRLNRRINRYSKQRQKLLLGIFCGITACLLALCVLVPFGKIAMKMPGENYQPAHIGLPSNLPARKAHLKTKDSLTTKINYYGKSTKRRNTAITHQ